LVDGLGDDEATDVPFSKTKTVFRDVGPGDHLCRRKGCGNKEGTPREFGSICIMLFMLVGSPQGSPWKVVIMAIVEDEQEWCSSRLILSYANERTGNGACEQYNYGREDSGDMLVISWDKDDDRINDGNIGACMEANGVSCSL